SHAKPSRALQGITLLETVVALAILAVLVAIGMPQVNATRHAARAGQAKAALLTSLLASTTRSAASERHVVLCSSSDGTGCNGGQAWHLGWMAFVDADGDRVHDPGEALLAAQPALGDGVRLFSTVGRTRLVFQPNGGNVGSNATFTLCDGRGAESAVTLVLSNAGRLREGRPSREATSRCVESL